MQTVVEDNVVNKAALLKSESRQASGTSGRRTYCIIKNVTSTRLKRSPKEPSGRLQWAR